MNMHLRLPRPAPRRLALLAAATFALTAGPAAAEKADRDKPVHLEADRVTIDDKQQLQTYEGNVLVSQGTLQIRCERMTVKQDNQGYQKGSAIGGPEGLARFRQKREGSAEYIEGEAERIEHDSRADRIEFFGRAHVKSGLDEVSGQYIVYDAKTENYVVTGGPGGSGGAAASPGQRVRAVIQPKNRDATAPTPAPAAAPGLKPAPALSNPRKESN